MKLRNVIFGTSLVLGGLLIASLDASASWSAQSAQSSIRAAVTARVTNEGGPPTISKIAISSNYALVLYSQGNGAGEALLAKTNGSWIVLIKGGGDMNEKLLVAEGVPTVIAHNLLEMLGCRAGIPCFFPLR